MADPASILWPSGHPTPPLSPRKRRRHLRESKESEGDMSLEQYMHSSDLYRSVSVVDPLPLPVEMETVSTLEQKIRPFYPEIEAIMRRHNLNVTSTFQCGNMSKPKYPGGHILLNFFPVYLNNSDPNIPPLGPIKDDIVGLFRRHKINAHVQVISSKHCHVPSAFFLSPQPILLC